MQRRPVTLPLFRAAIADTSPIKWCLPLPTGPAYSDGILPEWSVRGVVTSVGGFTTILQAYTIPTRDYFDGAADAALNNLNNCGSYDYSPSPGAGTNAYYNSGPRAFNAEKSCMFGQGLYIQGNLADEGATANIAVDLTFPPLSVSGAVGGQNATFGAGQLLTTTWPNEQWSDVQTWRAVPMPTICFVSDRLQSNNGMRKAAEATLADFGMADGDTVFTVAKPRKGIVMVDPIYVTTPSAFDDFDIATYFVVWGRFGPRPTGQNDFPLVTGLTGATACIPGGWPNLDANLEFFGDLSWEDTDASVALSLPGHIPQAADFIGLSALRQTGQQQDSEVTLRLSIL